jgi:PAS domain-containing protein
MFPESYSAVEHYLVRAMQGEAIAEVEVAGFPNKPGDEDGTALISYQPAWDEVGEVIGVAVAVVDITNRKRAEEALRKSEEHLRHMVELNPEIPWVMDGEGNNLDVSSRWVETTGLNEEQTRNLGRLEALHPEDMERGPPRFGPSCETTLRCGSVEDIDGRKQLEDAINKRTA